MDYETCVVVVVRRRDMYGDLLEKEGQSPIVSFREKRSSIAKCIGDF